CGARAHRGLGAAGWEGHGGLIQRRPRTIREAAGAAQRDHPYGPPCGYSVEPRQSGPGASNRKREGRGRVIGSTASTPGGPRSQRVRRRLRGYGQRASGALLVVADAVFNIHRARLVDLAVKNRLPSMYGIRESVEAGGLMFYGHDVLGQARHAATFVDKIFKGAKPADLPVQQPTKFE